MNFKVILAIFLGLTLALPPATYALDLEISGAETQEVIKLLAKEANLNVVLSGKIAGQISVNLHKTSALEALHTVLKLNGLVALAQKRTLIIMPASSIKNLSSYLQHQYFTLKHLPVERAQKMLQSSGLISELGKTSSDTNTNTLIVSDLDANLINIKDFVTRLDKPTKQIIIEARIVSIDSSVTQDLGLELSLSQKTPALAPALSHAAKVKNVIVAPTSQQANLLTFTLAKLHDFHQLDLKLAALENDGLAKVISKPKLITTDHQAASIETGTEIPYQEVNKDGFTNTTFKKAVLSLTVTPQLITSSEVNLNISLNQDKVGHLAVNSKPSIDTRKIQTQTVAKNHETIVLGGIYEQNSSRSHSKMPIVGDMPLVKSLFSRKTKRLERRELLIFVTPHIIMPSAPIL